MRPLMISCAKSWHETDPGAVQDTCCLFLRLWTLEEESDTLSQEWEGRPSTLLYLAGRPQARTWGDMEGSVNTVPSTSVGVSVSVCFSVCEHRLAPSCQREACLALGWGAHFKTEEKREYSFMVFSWTPNKTILLKVTYSNLSVIDVNHFCVKMHSLVNREVFKFCNSDLLKSAVTDRFCVCCPDSDMKSPETL